jgi:hypothetical protein
MSIAFTIRRADLKRFIALADKEKPSEGLQWKVFLKVEGHIATLKVHEESAQYPVRTDSPGLAQLLTSNLREILYENRRDKELNIVIGYGYIECCKYVGRSDEIRYGISCEVMDGYVFYPHRVDILAIYNLTDKAKREKLGIDGHLSDVHESFVRDIKEASSILGKYCVPPQEIQEMADKAISAEISRVRVRYGL